MATSRRPAVRSTESEIEAAMAELPAWTRRDGSISRDVACGTFADAISLVVRIAFVAEAADHHPDLDVRWRTLTVALTTHECSGLSGRDFDLARKIDALAAAWAR